MKIFKNQWSNIILIVLIIAMVLPQTRKPIQIFFNKLISFAPSINAEEDREKISDYNWVLENENGKRIEFLDYQNEVVIVNFWATWCPPCIAEMPSFQKLYEDYQGKVKFIFVSNETHETVENFRKSKRYTFPSFKMLTKAPAPLDGRTLPTTYVIDENGSIIVDKVGSADWNNDGFRKTLDKLIREN